MSKNKKQLQQPSLKVTEIDYEKLAKCITKSIIESKKDEEKQIELKEEEKYRNWRSTIGMREHFPNERLFDRIKINVGNDFRALMAFIFYKKDYAKDTRMAFASMAMISSLIFKALEVFFILLSLAVIYLVFLKSYPVWFLSALILTLFFAKLMCIIRMEIDQMESNEMINMIFSSLMAFIAALFTVLAFIRG